MDNLFKNHLGFMLGLCLFDNQFMPETVIDKKDGKTKALMYKQGNNLFMNPVWSKKIKDGDLEFVVSVMEIPEFKYKVGPICKK